jgi:hypothetical protein
MNSAYIATQASKDKMISFSTGTSTGAGLEYTGERIIARSRPLQPLSDLIASPSI